MTRFIQLLCALVLLGTGGTVHAQDIQDFSQGVGLWKSSPQKIGRSKVPGWKIVKRRGGKAIRNSVTSSRATYYWKLTRVFNLRDVEEPKLVMTFDFRGHGYSGMMVQIGDAKARRKRDFTTLYRHDAATGVERIELDLAEYAGAVRTLRVVLRKPRGVVEKKIGLYVHSLGVITENTIFAPECAPYNRRMYRHWTDEDRDCQDTRQESLIAGAKGVVTYLDKSQCRLFAGSWTDPYTGLRFDNPLHLDVDHMVPLKEAHDSGAWAWDAEERRQFANQLVPAGQLFVVQAAANRKKGAKDPAEWLPPNEDFHAEYARVWISVKLQWNLTADASELAALRAILGDDPDIVYPDEAPEVNCRQGVRQH
jgi:hypothetical protein